VASLASEKAVFQLYARCCAASSCLEAAPLIQPSTPDVAIVRTEKKIWIFQASLAFSFQRLP